MLPIAQRLDLRHLWQSLRGGRTHHTKYLRITQMPAQDFRAGVVASAKVFPTAVERNRFKRRLRSLLITMKQKHTGWYILSAKPSAKTASYADLHQDILSFFA